MTKAIPYMRLVRAYALRRGLFFFTWQQQCIARRLYEAEIIHRKPSL